MATLEELIVHIGVDDSDVETGMDNTAGIFKSSLSKIGLGLGVAGGALEAFNRSQQDTTVAINNLADATGISEDAIRDLATETSNATFPLEEVLDLMETGRKSGLQSAESLQEYATLWDMVGDATGESGPELAKAGVALRGLGIAAGEEKEALDAFGFIMRETNTSVGDFLKFVERTGPELRDLGLDVDETAGLLSVMETKFGLSGRTARQEFREAVSKSDGSLKDLLKTLKITPEEFEAADEAVKGSGKAIEEQAQNVADSKTALQGIEDTLNDLMTTVAPFAETIGVLAPILIGLGIAMKLASIGTWLFNTALLANPITWIILAIIALIAIIVLLVMHWDTVVAAVSDAWDAVVEAVGSAIDWITGKIGAGLDWLRGIWDNVWKFVEDRINDAVTTVRGWITNAVTWIIQRINFLRRLPGMVGEFFRNMAVRAITKGVQLINWVRKLPGKVVGFLSGLGGRLVAAGRNALNGLWNGLKSVWNSIAAWFREKVDWITGLWPFSPPEHGPLRARPLDKAGANVMGDLQAGIEAGTPALLGQLRDVAEAVSMPGVEISTPGMTVPDVPDVRRGGDGAALAGDLPEEFVATATIDLGDGIDKKIELKFQRKDRDLKRRVKAGAGAAR